MNGIQSPWRSQAVNAANTRVGRRADDHRRRDLAGAGLRRRRLRHGPLPRRSSGRRAAAPSSDAVRRHPRCADRLGSPTGSLDRRLRRLLGAGRRPAASAASARPAVDRLGGVGLGPRAPAGGSASAASSAGLDRRRARPARRRVAVGPAAARSTAAGRGRLAGLAEQVGVLDGPRAARSPPPRARAIISSLYPMSYAVRRSARSTWAIR